jgi:prepilin-type N-terminal cleavage/methylation domain-containing protein
MKKQAGFTLVEIAIVMVIIGLLLGGVLKGQEIITNAKARNIENEFNGVTAAIYSYQDRYRAYPGDDRNATARWTAVTTNSATKGNGKIEGPFDSTTDSDESRLLWQHLRNARLVAGKTDDTSNPNNAFGGITGVATGATGTGGNGVNINWLFIGFSNIPQNIAVILESRLDDNGPQSGTIQAQKNDKTTAGTTYIENEIYRLFFAL